MKTTKIIAAVLSLFVCGMSYAGHTRYGVAGVAENEYSRAARAVSYKISQSEEQLLSKFHEWALKGNATAFYEFMSQTRTLQQNSSKECAEGTVLAAATLSGVCVHPEIVLGTDISQNNLLHNAKDNDTVEAVMMLFSLFLPQGQNEINELKNKKNRAGETPLIKHVSFGDLESFYNLYEGSFVQASADKINEISHDPSPLVRSTLEIHKQAFLQHGGANAAKETLVSLVQRAPDEYRKGDILYFCEEKMPFLF